MFDNLDFMLNHRSIRAWKKDPIEEDLMAKFFEIANRTSTSNGMQNASIIRVKDPEKRRELAEVAGQKYLQDCPELLIFVADCYRNVSIMKEKKSQEILANDADRFFQGWTDASLMAQSIAIAAESCGIGIVYFGSILNDAKKTIEILKLPENTFPVVGLGMGYPDQEPQLKPRMDVAEKVFVDEYKKSKSYLEDLKDYDQEMKTYYDLRNAKKALDAFTDQVVDKNDKHVAKRSEIFEVIKEQGFKF
ncbi:MAG: nitroreductase family protein [Tissierellia bacterium]|nr:nitroreductase family protein [Tissierellia bacterium]